jgi:hypothetical protein
MGIAVGAGALLVGGKKIKLIFFSIFPLTLMLQQEDY